MKNPLRTLLLALPLVAPALAAPAAAQTPCGITPYGVGLGGANTGTLASPSTPAPGAPVAFELTDFTMGPAFGVVVVAAAQVSLPFAGGTLLVNAASPLSRHAVLYDVFAQAIVSVPNDPSVVGVTVHAQAGLFYPTSGSVELSNGLTVTVCP